MQDNNSLGALVQYKLNTINHNGYLLGNITLAAHATVQKLCVALKLSVS